jgi:hypothetical protein
MAAITYRPFKIITFNASGILRRRYELSKQLRDSHTCIYVALLSETHPKPHERLSFQIINFIQLAASRDKTHSS